VLGARNKVGLTQDEIARCIQAWQALCEDRERPLDVSEAAAYGSRTRFVQDRNVVVLGADALPGPGLAANARMSMPACLAHEIAHAERFEIGYDRPFKLPDSLIDEAETSLRASFSPVLTPRDREDLIEDARDRVIHWLAMRMRETG
jgi:hypothetical protein